MSQSYTFRVGGTTAILAKLLLGLEEWLRVTAIEIGD